MTKQQAGSVRLIKNLLGKSLFSLTRMEAQDIEGKTHRVTVVFTDRRNGVQAFRELSRIVNTTLNVNTFKAESEK